MYKGVLEYYQNSISKINKIKLGVLLLLLMCSRSYSMVNSEDSLKHDANLYNLLSVNELYYCPCQARDYAQKALILAISNNNIEEEARAYENIANAALGLDEMETAAQNFMKAITVYKKTQNNYKIADLDYKTGCIHYNLGEIGKGISILKDGIRYAQMSNNKEALYKIYERLSVHAEKTNNTKEAVKFLIEHTTIKDSIIEEKNQKEILELEKRYQKERNDRKLKMLTAENVVQNLQLMRIKVRIYLLLVVTLLIVGVSSLIIGHNKKKIQQRMLELERRLLRFQMNPHFIFNALTSIQSMVIKNDKESAVQHITNFSELTNFTFNNIKEEYISIEDEIISIKQYLELQKIVLKNKLSYSFEIDDTLNLKQFAIPPMLLQPFIENAIIHGIYHKKDEGLIVLRIFNVDNFIQIEIEDNGIGREKAKQYKNNRHKSYATSITKNRLENIDTLLSKKSHFEVIDLYDSNSSPSGTKVLFKLPVSYI